MKYMLQEPDPTSRRVRKTTEISVVEVVLWVASHLHLSLCQISPELLGRIHDLPLVSQHVHPDILDIAEGESR